MFNLILVQSLQLKSLLHGLHVPVLRLRHNFIHFKLFFFSETSIEDENLIHSLQRVFFPSNSGEKITLSERPK